MRLWAGGMVRNGDGPKGTWSPRASETLGCRGGRAASSHSRREHQARGSSSTQPGLLYRALRGGGRRQAV